MQPIASIGLLQVDLYAVLFTLLRLKFVIDILLFASHDCQFVNNGEYDSCRIIRDFLNEKNAEDPLCKLDDILSNPRGIFDFI
jgi:hypothetical protein